jgi:hypothetical protein
MHYSKFFQPRVTSDDIMKYPIRFGVGCSANMAWLSQANHIFSRLGITSNFEDYGLILLPVGLYNNLST